MRVGVVKLSELGDRWDAGFHLDNQKYKDQAAAIEKTVSRKKAIEILEAMPADVLNLISNLHRGTGVAAKPKRDALIRAAHEYPFLALAIIKAEGAELLEQKRAEAISAAEKISSLIDEKLGKVAEACAMIEAEEGGGGTPGGNHDWLTKIDACVEGAIKNNNFVAGVVYFDGDQYSIPVETSSTAYVADCWVIDVEDFNQEAVQDLFEEGNVPVPRRPEDLGQPVGFFNGLPDHTKNYGFGWR